MFTVQCQKSFTRSISHYFMFIQTLIKKEKAMRRVRAWDERPLYQSVHVSYVPMLSFLHPPIFHRHLFHCSCPLALLLFHRTLSAFTRLLLHVLFPTTWSAAFKGIWNELVICTAGNMWRLRFAIAIVTVWVTAVSRIVDILLKTESNRISNQNFYSKNYFFCWLSLTSFT